MSLRDRLRRDLFGTRAARLGALHELTNLAPVAIIADVLGYSAKTIESHASASGADYALRGGDLRRRVVVAKSDDTLVPSWTGTGHGIVGFVAAGA